MSINICSRLSDLRSKDSVVLDLPDTSFNTSIEALRQLIINRLQLASEVDLVAFGKVLRDDKSLAHYGIKGTTTIYVFKKRSVSHISCMSSEAIEASKANQTKPESNDYRGMASALKLALRSADFRSMLSKLNNRDDREKLMAFTPGLREDPIVMAILQDPELFNLCVEDVSNFAHVVDLHPVLAIAAENLAATFHESNPDSHTFSAIDPRPRYGLDDSDDDDDDDGEGASAAPQPASTDVIARMLQQALASANSNLQQARRASAAQPSTSSTTSQQPLLNEPTSRSVTDGSLLQQRSATAAARPSAPRPPAPVITPTMLQQAISMAANPQPIVVPSPQHPPAPVRPPAPDSVRPAIRSWTNELARLRELGITDEAYSIQVLEVTNGNFEAAVNILLGGENQN